MDTGDVKESGLMSKNTKELEEKLYKNIEKAINIFGTERDKNLLKKTKDSENRGNEYGRSNK